MKSCGVIVEYNPFHNGHQYHLKEARKKSEADVIVAVMSGNFLQRGEPAILDKWTRTREALLNGADLIIELPFAYAVQSADYFTRGGVKLLHALQVDSLCFGTDIKEPLDYEAFGLFHEQNKKKIDSYYQQIKNNGQSYPQQMTEVYRQLLPEWSLDFSSPNHILGMGYAKENARYKKPMTLYPIERLGNNYHDKAINHEHYASATSIRQQVLTGQKDRLDSVLPKESALDLTESDLVSWGKAWPLLKYQLISTDLNELKKTYQMVEGLEYRLKEMALKSETFQEFVENVKSKRYTWTRIQRLCLYSLVKVQPAQIKKMWENPYLRVLGFNEVGRQFLNTQKNKLEIPIITNVNQKNEHLLSLDIKAGQVYSLLRTEEKAQDYYRSPIYIKEEIK